MLNQQDIGGIEITFEDLTGIDRGMLCDLGGLLSQEPDIEDRFREFFMEQMRHEYRFFVLDCRNLAFDSFRRADFLFAAFAEIRSLGGDLVLLGFPELTLPFRDPELGFPFKRVDNLTAAIVEISESQSNATEQSELKIYVNSLVSRFFAAEKYYAENVGTNPKMAANLRAVREIQSLLSRKILRSSDYVAIQDALTTTEMWEFHSGSMWREFVHVLNDLVFYKLNHPKLMYQEFYAAESRETLNSPGTPD